jgi:hypothetical protein
MDKLIEELRAQRNQIQLHLDWIDRKLAEAEHAKTPSGTSTKQAPSRLSEKKEPATEAQISPPRPQTPDEGPDPEKFATAPIQGDVNKARAGCFILFVAGIGLFFFLLFILPNLLY